MGHTISFAEGLQREAPGANGSAMLNIGAAVAKGGEGPNMDATLSFLISAGIMANGLWCLDCRGRRHCWIANGLDVHGASAHGRRLDQPLSGSQRRKICVAGFANRFALLTR
jgi:hypothetical protein